MSKRRTWKSFLRFSMRSLLLMILALGVWMGSLVHRAHVQRDAVAAIVNAGGKVYYDWQLFGDGRFNSQGRLLWPGWLVDQIGVDYFSTVRQAFLMEVELNEEPAHVGRLRQIERLYLYGPSVTDAHLLHLSKLTRLQGLCLEKSRVSDAGLVHLKGLRRLKSLNLKGTMVTDAGVQQLQSNLPGLEIYR